jgi:hypothetical protein
MLHFCTLFDSNYLARALAMYRSLERHCPAFHLYVFAFDQKAEEVLQSLALKNVTVIGLQQFEDEALLAVKGSRTRAEYCWTSTSSTIRYVLKNFQTPHCTYLDADLYFYANPQLLIDEMPKDKSVMITAHRYTPAYDKSALSGKYCVQFMYFRNDAAGLEVLEWWRNACLEWCFNRFEDGKFGDQKYLDDWTNRFETVHDLHHLGGGLAPWNIQQYQLVGPSKLIEKKSKMAFDAVFFHFHGVKIYPAPHAIYAPKAYLLSTEIRQNFYRPYVTELRDINTELSQHWPGQDFNASGSTTDYWKQKILVGNIEFIRRNFLPIF